MAKIDITRTELLWPGKYNGDGTLKETPRVNLPFQVIETINESRAGREGVRLFFVGGPERPMGLCERHERAT